METIPLTFFYMNVRPLNMHVTKMDKGYTVNSLFFFIATDNKKHIAIHNYRIIIVLKLAILNVISDSILTFIKINSKNSSKNIFF